MILQTQSHIISSLVSTFNLLKVCFQPAFRFLSNSNLIQFFSQSTYLAFWLLLINVQYLTITKISYLWHFDELRRISTVLLYSYKGSNKKSAITPSFLFLIFKKFLENSSQNHQFWRCWHSFSLIQTKLCCCLKQHGLLLITGYNWLKS